MQVRVKPSHPLGAVRVPPAKSLAHRAIICACLADGTSRLQHIAYSKDILATIGCMRALGAQITEFPDSLEIRGISFPAAPESLFLDCCESGSTLRFLIPLASLTGKGVVFTGRGRLLSRPQGIYEDLFTNQHLAFACLPDRISIRGALRPDCFTFRGDVSSQFITGLLFALPLLNGDSEIRVLPPFESRSYVELTLQTLKRFGISATFTEKPAEDGSIVLRIPGNQRYQPCDITIEGDWSQAAFFAVLGAVGGQVECLGLPTETQQGDAVILDILRRFGANARPLAESGHVGETSWTFEKSSLSGQIVDLADCPDLGPILTVLAARSKGETRILNAGRLRFKESDRAAAMEQELTALGAAIHTEEDTIQLKGCGASSILDTESPSEYVVFAHNDHRIAMSLVIYAVTGNVPVVIDGAECVEKSYPDFWQDLQKVGVSVEQLPDQENPVAPTVPTEPVVSQSCLTGRARHLTPETHILIVGLGLIGGSYARALAKYGCTVTAIDCNPDSIAYAKEQGFLTDGATGGAEAERFIREADIIVIGLYPLAMVDWVLEHQTDFRPGLLLTDVSGVKRAVLYRVQEALRPDVEFIGSHPMAGREVSGVRNSDDHIFRDANFIITPTERNTEEAVDFVRELGETLGFRRISTLSPEQHDQMIGYLSQLTHAIAVSLMNANGNPHLVEYTGDSFRDLTRIARINETLWSELFALNRDVLIPEIDSFIVALEDLKEKLSQGDEQGLKQLFIQSTERRKQFDRPVPEKQE